MAHFSDLPLEWIKEHLGNSEAHLLVWLRGCFLRGLTEEGRTALNVHGAIPWAGLLEGVKWAKEAVS